MSEGDFLGVIGCGLCVRVLRGYEEVGGNWMC